MAYDYSELLADAQAWGRTALEQGYLQSDQAQRLLQLDHADADQLFGGSSQQRPLIVAFMGGTGVGKSSLLNRLAGQPIAKVGVERPTSREVTLYHHRHLTLQQFSNLPLDTIRIGQHDDEANRQIVWIDMPDFDSIETSNQQLVLNWLPHIDVLLYVVSPERYRDSKAWRLMLAEGVKHAWLFVMNQWDRGQAVQYDDFIRQLSLAGFSQPLVYRCSCAEPEGDEFDRLLAELQRLSGQQNREQMEARLNHQRKLMLLSSLETIDHTFAEQDFCSLNSDSDALCQRLLDALRQGFAWPIQQLARQWGHELSAKAECQLWDAWAQSRFDDMIDELILKAVQAKLPAKPLKTALQPIRHQARERFDQQMLLSGRQALLKPGNGMQRFLHRLTAIAETALPLLAMAVVGYRVYFGFYQSATEDKVYLGTDFAIHSVLLIGLSWLIPYFLHQKIKPSLEKSADKGLQKGLAMAVDAVAVDIENVLQQQLRQQQSVRQQLQLLIERCRSETATRQPADALLDRILVGDRPTNSIATISTTY